MDVLMNRLVKSYLRKWSVELSKIKTNAIEVQEEELDYILDAPLVQYFHPGIDKSTFRTMPLSKYEDYQHLIELLLKSDHAISCRYFAQSSGTTSGTKKLIPTPDLFVKRNLLRGSWYQLHTLYEHNPHMSVFKSKNLLIGGALYEHNSRYTIGDVSGIMISRIPRYMHPWYVPRIREAISPDWEEKIRLTALAASKTNHISLLAGTPTWVLSTMRMVLDKTGLTMASDQWPTLQAYIHGGVRFEPYRSQFEALIDIHGFRYIEVYNATEGFFAYQDRPNDQGMLLMCTSGIYFEFIRLEDFRKNHIEILTLGEVSADQSYVMLITTLSGLVRYVQGDIVRFETIAPFRILVEGRIGEYINAFGEDLMLKQAEEALLNVSLQHACTIKNYTVAPNYINIQRAGFHEWFIEFEQTPESLNLFAKDLDDHICRLNTNYNQKRSGDIAMSALKIHSLPSGSILRYLQSKGSITGQTKLPRLRNDRSIADALLSMTPSEPS